MDPKGDAVAPQWVAERATAEWPKDLDIPCRLSRVYFLMQRPQLNIRKSPRVCGIDVPLTSIMTQDYCDVCYRVIPTSIFLRAQKE
jgi:hypothetical protein